MVSENSHKTVSILLEKKAGEILKWLRLQKQIMQISFVHNFIDVGADYFSQVFLE